MPTARLAPRIARTTPLALAPEAPEAQDRTLSFEFARFINQHSTDYIRMADSKAAVLVTLLSANLLVLVQRASTFLTEPPEPWKLALVVFACAFALVSLAVAINIIRPRLFRNPKPGHVFWEVVAPASSLITPHH